MANEAARVLRKAMTPQEVKLWSHLRRLRSQGYHFRRQAPLAGYILDFVCFRRRLIIEIDGGHHGLEGQWQHDARRNARFSSEGFATLRFSNDQVDFQGDDVYRTILRVLAERE